MSSTSLEELIKDKDARIAEYALEIAELKKQLSTKEITAAAERESLIKDLNQQRKRTWEAMDSNKEKDEHIRNLTSSAFVENHIKNFVQKYKNTNCENCGKSSSLMEQANLSSSCSKDCQFVEENLKNAKLHLKFRSIHYDKAGCQIAWSLTDLLEKLKEKNVDTRHEVNIFMEEVNTILSEIEHDKNISGKPLEVQQPEPEDETSVEQDCDKSESTN